MAQYGCRTTRRSLNIGFGRTRKADTNRSYVLYMEYVFLFYKRILFYKVYDVQSVSSTD